MRDMLNIIIIFLVLMNVILACYYIYMNNCSCNDNRENYEYGIKLYRDTVNKQYSQFCKNNPN